MVANVLELRQNQSTSTLPPLFTFWDPHGRFDAAKCFRTLWQEQDAIHQDVYGESAIPARSAQRAALRTMVYIIHVLRAPSEHVRSQARSAYLEIPDALDDLMEEARRHLHSIMDATGHTVALKGLIKILELQRSRLHTEQMTKKLKKHGAREFTQEMYEIWYELLLRYVRHDNLSREQMQRLHTLIPALRQSQKSRKAIRDLAKLYGMLNEVGQPEMMARVNRMLELFGTKIREPGFTTTVRKGEVTVHVKKGRDQE